MAKATDCKSVIYRFESGGRLFELPHFVCAECGSGVFNAKDISPVVRVWVVCLSLRFPIYFPFPSF